MDFKLHSQYKPTGDQPQAIAQLVEGINDDLPAQTLHRGDGFRQNVHYGQCHSGSEEADTDPEP